LQLAKYRFRLLDLEAEYSARERTAHAGWTRRLLASFVINVLATVLVALLMRLLL
jgi:hypothetical protein